MATFYDITMTKPYSLRGFVLTYYEKPQPLTYSSWHENEAQSCLCRNKVHKTTTLFRPGIYMKVYLVGGAVRDKHLGLAVQDRDYIVVGATPEQMVERGFKPVGADFPVFLHPQTKEEYALARTERKSGRGYKGFTVYAAPDVTLEDDLRRRDLTINAMAEDEAGNLIDPF